MLGTIYKAVQRKERKNEGRKEIRKKDKETKDLK